MQKKELSSWWRQVYTRSLWMAMLTKSTCYWGLDLSTANISLNELWFVSDTEANKTNWDACRSCCSTITAELWVSMKRHCYYTLTRKLIAATKASKRIASRASTARKQCHAQSKIYPRICQTVAMRRVFRAVSTLLLAKFFRCEENSQLWEQRNITEL